MNTGSSTPSGPTGSTPVWGAVVVIVGLLVVAGVFAGALVKFSDSKDVVAVIGAVTGVVGTIVTAFFGIHATASAGADASTKVAAAGADATTKVAAAGADAANKLTSAADKAAAAQQDSHDKALALAAYLDPDKAEEVLTKFRHGNASAQPTVVPSESNEEGSPPG
jgi:cytochrome bd-type quinol oxidase subunit 1